MAKLSATPDVVVVDVDAGQTSGVTTVAYEKDPLGVAAGGSWSRVNVHVRTGLGDVADRKGGVG